MTGVPRNRRAALGVTHARILEKPFELETLIDLVSAMLAAARRPRGSEDLPGRGRLRRARAVRRGAPPLAVAIGNFDGVHRGHQALLDEARARAAAPRRAVGGADLHAAPGAAVRARQGAAAHHVARAPAGAAAPRRGSTSRSSRPFTPAFAAIEADEFVRRVLAQDLAAGDVVVGYDFSFGRGRAGNVARLAALGAELGLGVAVIPPVTVDGLPCSSTRVRELVRGGRRPAGRRAARPAGRDRGARSCAARRAAGRSASRPPTSSPRASWCRSSASTRRAPRLLDGPEAGAVHQAALSIGRNPTFTGPGTGAPVTVEAHLLDFDGDLYDRRLRLEILDRLRDEQRFDVDRRAGRADHCRRRPRPRDRVLTCSTPRRWPSCASGRGSPIRRSGSSAGSPRWPTTPSIRLRYETRIAELGARSVAGADRDPRAARDASATTRSRSSGACRPRRRRPTLQVLLMRRGPDGIETDPRTLPLGGPAGPHQLRRRQPLRRARRRRPPRSTAPSSRWSGFPTESPNARDPPRRGACDRR